MFLEGNNTRSEIESVKQLNNSTTSSAWPADLYFENQEGDEPLRAAIENNCSA